MTGSFVQKLAVKMGIPSSRLGEFSSFIQRWAQHEGTGAQNNPLATTQVHPRSVTPWNDLGGGQGVQQYADEDAGVEATAQTLQNGYYNTVVDYLRTGSGDPGQMASEIDTWGTHGLANEIRGGGAPAGGNQMADPEVIARYSGLQAKRDQIHATWGPLSDKWAIIQGLPKTAWTHTAAGFVGVTQEPQDDGAGGVTWVDVPDETQVFMTDAEYAQFQTLDRQLAEVEDQITAMDKENAGGESVTDSINRAEFGYKTDPKTIDAQNKADQYAREYTARQDAARVASDRLTEQSKTQAAAVEGFKNARLGQAFSAPATFMPSADDLFKTSLETITKGLPVVPGMPNYSGSSLPGARQSLASQVKPVSTAGHDLPMPIRPLQGTPRPTDFTDLPPGVTSPTATGVAAPVRNSGAGGLLNTMPTIPTVARPTAPLPGGTSLPTVSKRRTGTFSQRFKGTILGRGF